MDKVRVWFATNRNHQPRNADEPFGTAFNPDGVAALRFGHADFQAGPDPAMTSLSVIPDPKPGKDDPNKGSAAFLDELRTAMSAGERTDTLAFVHGYNVSFLGALKAGALLAQSLTVDSRPVNVVVFSWPSDGRNTPWAAYYSDREDARASGPALARAFLKFRDWLLQLGEEAYCQRCVHLLAHSMGAYVLRQGLQALRVKDPKNGVSRLFEQIMLAAPDEDDDAFESDDKLKQLPQLGRGVTVYFNPDDRALLISDTTKANPDRLGSDGPRLVDLLPKKVSIVDCREVAGDADRWVEHSYYIRSEAMAQDLGAVMQGTAPEMIGNRTYVERQRCWRLGKELGVKPVVVPH